LTTVRCIFEQLWSLWVRHSFVN